MKKSEFIALLERAVGLVSKITWEPGVDSNNWETALKLLRTTDPNGPIAQALAYFASNATNPFPNLGAARLLEAAWEEFQAETQTNEA